MIVHQLFPLEEDTYEMILIFLFKVKMKIGLSQF